MTRLLRKCLSSPSDDYTFRRPDDTHLNLDNDREYGWYLHVPFCKSMCPYCPYNKVSYQKDLASSLKDALMREILRYSDEIGRRKFSSLYIGGGTPTLCLDELAEIIRLLKKCFELSGTVAIETTPGDLTDLKAEAMRDMGIHYVSLGVQSFQDRYLSLIGRNYKASEALAAVELLSRKKFELFNVDLIFAFPGETIDELLSDLKAALNFEPPQVTCYPLFTFPYTAIGRYRKLKRLKMPPVFLRKKMYYALCDFFRRAGYHQTSVWGFNRNGGAPYSSVTRDYYLGLGPGAASYTGKAFYFNTFSVEEYIRASKDRRPVALKMSVSKTMEKLFWLYWRFYETRISPRSYERYFKAEFKKDFGWIPSLLKWTGCLSQEDGEMRLNRRGAHWIHWLQNHYALNYVNRIWSTCQEHAWPESVRL